MLGRTRGGHQLLIKMKRTKCPPHYSHYAYFVPYHACEAASRYVPTHWIKPCVPGDCPMNEGGFLELLAYAKGLSSAQATSRGNQVAAASGTSDLGMAGSGGLAITGKAAVADGLPPHIKALIAPVLLWMSQQCGLEPREDGECVSGFAACAIGYNQFVPSCVPYLGPHNGDERVGQSNGGHGGRRCAIFYVSSSVCTFGD